MPHSDITLLFTFIARVTLVSRVTARSLQNNIVGYVPPSGERSCSKCVKPLSVGYKFVDTHLYHSRQWFNTLKKPCQYGGTCANFKDDYLCNCILFLYARIRQKKL